MTPRRLRRYARAQARTDLGPEAHGHKSLDILDMHVLTLACGPNCTTDGIHYAPAVSEAALQILLHLILERSESA